jgi:hypothetical protein
VTVFVLRHLAGLMGFLLLVVVAVGGLAIALFCIQGGTATLSLAHLASLLSLDDLRDTVDPWLSSLEADGPTAVLAALCGLAVTLLGVGLLVGALVPRRERLLVIARGEHGDISARRRAAAAALAALAERPREVLRARAKVRPNRRRPGGRARLELVRAAGTDERPSAKSSRAELASLGEQMSLKLQSISRQPRHGGRAL